jgi:tyrosyl-tRNA synthetase
LDSRRTSPYAFYQFWLGTADVDVYKFLKYFTFLSVAEIDALQEADVQRQGKPDAQAVLAREVTRIVHGEEGLSAAERITESLFSGSLEELAEDDLLQLRQDGLPSSSVDRSGFPLTLTHMLVEAGMAASGKQVKDALGRDAVTINNLAVGAAQNGDVAACFDVSRALFERFYLVRLGKKKYHLFEVG